MYSRCTQTFSRLSFGSAETCPQNAIQNAHSVKRWASMAMASDSTLSRFASPRVALARQPLLDALQDQPQGGEDDVLLGFVVMGHHAGGVARRARDARHRRLLESVVGDHLAGDQRDLVAALGMVDDLGHGRGLRRPAADRLARLGRHRQRGMGLAQIGSSFARSAASIAMALAFAVSTYKCICSPVAINASSRLR